MQTYNHKYELAKVDPESYPRTKLNLDRFLRANGYKGRIYKDSYCYSYRIPNEYKDRRKTLYYPPNFNLRNYTYIEWLNKTKELYDETIQNSRTT